MQIEPERLPLVRGLIGISAVIIILAGLKFGTDIASPIFMGLVLTLLLAPILSWLKRFLPAWLATVAMSIGLILLFVFLGRLFALSAQSLREGIATYSAEIQTHFQELENLLNSVGIGGDSSTATTQAAMTVLTFVISALVQVLSYFFPVFILCLFFLTEGGELFERAQKSLPNNPVLVRFSTFGRAVALQFGLRGIVNAITGAAFTGLLILLGVDYAVLWGVLTFFLSYIPYIGIVLAGVPAVILAFAEYGLERALLVIAALAVVNVGAENLLAPALMGRGLHISTTVAFTGFMFWLWLLGAPGAFLAMPLTILVIMLLDSFPETRWMADIAMRPTESATAGDTSPPSSSAKSNRFKS